MKQFILFTFYILCSLSGYSCTTFVISNENSLVFGRNLDWVSDNGVIVVNKRNVSKTSLVFPPEKATSWTSKYGSVSFNQFGKEFPFGGMNEKGLVVEIMLVDGSYPSKDNRTAVNELQWVQYQLDNAATIDEVIASDKLIRISKINQTIHFLICDKAGNTAVIEFDKKGMNVYRGEDLPFPVLENDPYSKSLEKHEDKFNCRFRTAATMIESYQANPVGSVIGYSFTILDKVALDGSWSIVYDIKNGEIHFKTASDQTIRKIDINEFNFDCSEVSKLYDLRLKNTGFINSKFVDFSTELNKTKFNAALRSNQIQLPQDVLNLFYNYQNECYCAD